MQIPKTLGFLPVNILGLCLYSEYVTPKGATHILRIIIPGERSTALSPLLWPQDSQWHLCASFRCARPLEPSATALTIGHSLPRSSGGRKSTVKVLVGRLLPRPLCRASRWPSSLCPHTVVPPGRPRPNLLRESLGQRTASPTPMTSLYLNYLSK